MSIPETYHFDNTGEVVRYPSLRRYFVASSIVLLTLLSFGIGRLTAEKREGVTINYPDSAPALASAPARAIGASQAAAVYASSQGTRYYYTNCKSTVLEKNRVTFATAAMAEAAGYTLAANCNP